MPKTAEDLTFRAYTDDRINAQINRAFRFMRQHSGGVYSNNTLMALLQTEGMSGEQNPLASIVFASDPPAYDEETEIKTGGIVGCYITWKDGRCLLAVKRGWRRKRVASKLINYTYCNNPVFFWIHRNNTVAQQFMLSHGLAPTAMNSRGALRFAAGEEQE